MRPSRGLRVAAVLALAGFSGFTLLYSSGITGVTKKPNHVFFEPGCFCHGDSASPGVAVWIEGPDTLEAGTQALFRLSVARDSAAAAGFNAAAFSGPLAVADSPGTQLMEPAPGEAPELTHVLPRAAAGSDTITWTFFYRAPLTGGVVDTLYANGNVVNLNGDPSGDEWNFAPNFTVVVRPVVSADERTPPAGFRLLQNYPNPFNPSTSIPFVLPSRADIRLEVVDLGGRIVAVPAEGVREQGTQSVAFTAEGLASGVYLIRLLARSADGEFIAVRKMVLMR